MRVYRFIKIAALLFVVVMTATGCADRDLDIQDNDAAQGFIKLGFSLSPGSTMTRATVATDNGENPYNENDINTVDIFFYDIAADETTAAKFAVHEDDFSDEVSVSVKALNTAFGYEDGTHSCRVIVVANFNATKDMTEGTALPDIKSIKELVSTVDFKSAEAPVAFVMTNLGQTSNVLNWNDEGGQGTVNLKRVAAKIRLAMNVEKELPDDTDPEKKWVSDRQDMRLFISNGVNKSRLDGSHDVELAENDYYSIVTSGSKGDAANEEGDYYLSRRLTFHQTLNNEAPEEKDGEVYPYFNDIPYYTYPNSWEDKVLETTQTTLTIVVPWMQVDKNADDDNIDKSNVPYRLSYYTLPANSVSSVLESNKYYYLRAHIGMIGSLTPEKPMPVDIKCEIADWGTANGTDVSIRPLRFLQFNNTEFVMNNISDIEIPFSSTHDCMLESVKVTYKDFYTQSNGDGKDISNTVSARSGEKPLTLSAASNTKYPFTCTLNNEENTLTFTQSFNNANTYSPYTVEIKVRHNDDTNSAYSETIIITVNPPIYITTELISGTGWQDHDGYILVNGYGNSDGNTGNLGSVSNHSPTGLETESLTTFTVTQLSESDKTKWKWIIDDPRTFYINNELDRTSVKSDSENHFSIWTHKDYGGPYDGTQRSGGDNSTNRWRVSARITVDYDVKTIWEWYTGENWNIEYVDANGNKQTWNVYDDKRRTLKYYYPTSSSIERENIIAPKFTVVSGHAYSASAGGTGEAGLESARRRCATYQQYGYPAGRWRLPTYAEMKFVKILQDDKKIRDVFHGDHNWSATAVVDENGNKNGTGGYVRCVYDNWYWERYDNNHNTMNRIPKGSVTVYNNRTNVNTPPTTTKTETDSWKVFVWGDRPKENPEATRAGGKGYTAQDFLEENAPGNYVVHRKDDKVELEKMK